MKHDLIALTGGIGSGKSAVANILRENNYVVIDCDEISKEVSCDKFLIEEVASLLGSDCVNEMGLNRSIIRERIFRDADLYKQYSNMFWKRIKERLLDRIKCVESRTVFVEIAVFDAFEMDWKEIWLVESDVGTRIRRVVARDSVSAENVTNIISVQKIPNCVTRKILNNGTLSELKANVSKILKDAGL